MTSSALRHLPAKGAYNIRDLGGYKTVNGLIVPWRRFLRADSLHRLADGEAERLFDEGLRRVVDLRTAEELTTAPNPFAAYPGVHFVNLPMFDDLSPALMAKTAANDKLLAFYLAAIDTRKDAIRDIMADMAEADSGAVLFNCTAGKDRTGIIAALLLGLAGVGRDQIIADYAMTADYIPDLVAEFLELSRQRGGDVVAYAKMLESPQATMAATLDRLESEYGSVPRYLSHIGLADAEITRLKERLTAK